MTTPSQPAILVAEGVREALSIFQKEMITYARELPRLLEEGEVGRWIIIQGEQLLGTWDTYRDAVEHGDAVCGDLTFFTHKIVRSDLGVWEQFLIQEGFLPAPEGQSHANIASASSS